jgi:hypothetical protein
LQNITAGDAQNSEPDDAAIREWHRDMQVESVSYRVLHSSGWAMRRLAVLLAKVAALALSLALGAWLIGTLIA